MVQLAKKTELVSGNNSADESQASVNRDCFFGFGLRPYFKFENISKTVDMDLLFRIRVDPLFQFATGEVN